MTTLLNLNNLCRIAEAVGIYEAMHTEKNPYHTSTLSGKAYIEDIISSKNPRQIQDLFCMPKATFEKLSDWMKRNNSLQETRFVSVEEQLAIFMKIVGEKASNRTTQDRFQHSGDTISRHFNHLLNATLHLFESFVIQPQPNGPIPPQIQFNSKLYPYFKDCIGAIDGTHIPAKVPEEMMIPFRDRSDKISQNVLAACKFNLLFSYVLLGWEGSAHDARVLQHALELDFWVPEGKYYLADAGYGLRKGFLTPYQGVRYHLREQARAGQR